MSRPPFDWDAFVMGAWCSYTLSVVAGWIARVIRRRS